MPRPTLTRAEWEAWRPTLVERYKTRTADSIAQQMRNEHEVNVTAKMLRDRFKVWNAEPKYHRHQPVQPRRRRTQAKAPRGNNIIEFTVAVSLQMYQDAIDEPGQADFWGSASLAESDAIGVRHATKQDPDKGAFGELTLVNIPASYFMSPPPSRSPDTPAECRHLQKTLKEVAGYLDCIVEQGSWRHRQAEPAFELQKLTAQAHLALSSQDYDSHMIWRELSQLYDPVCHTVPRLDDQNLRTLHPRALVVLLRVLVDPPPLSPSSPEPLERVRKMSLARVRKMFAAVTMYSLNEYHPIRLLCGMPGGNSIELLSRLFELMDVRLYSKISSEQLDGPEFVGQEQTYAARVLASLGHTSWASAKLRSVVDHLDSHLDPYTKAEALRTQGYAMLEHCNNRCTSESTVSELQESKAKSVLALNLFIDMEKGCSNEAMYTRLALARVCRKLGELAETEAYLSEAIYVWQQTRRSEYQGGSKMILDLHQVLVEQSKFEEAQKLEEDYQGYFEESRG